MIDKKRRTHSSEEVQNIDFSHSSRKASSVGRSQWQVKTFLHHCPVPANVIAAQLLRNEKYERANRETSRQSKEVSCRWRTPKTTPVNISDDFTAAEFAAALQIQSRIKLRDRLHMSAADHPCRSNFKVLVMRLLLYLLAPPQNIQSPEKSFCSRDPKALKT